MSKVRGIRGAIQVRENTRQSLLDATKALLKSLLRENDIAPGDIASIFFTATDDLNAEFPAYAAREMGLTTVPLLCAREMQVPGNMSRLIRILMHVNTDKSQKQIKHQYLGETASLRPDLNMGDMSDDSHNED